jgi:hypothetical protein
MNNNFFTNVVTINEYDAHGNLISSQQEQVMGAHYEPQDTVVHVPHIAEDSLGNNANQVTGVTYHYNPLGQLINTEMHTNQNTTSYQETELFGSPFNNSFTNIVTVNEYDALGHLISSQEQAVGAHYDQPQDTVLHAFANTMGDALVNNANQATGVTYHYNQLGQLIDTEVHTNQNTTSYQEADLLFGSQFSFFSNANDLSNVNMDGYASQHNRGP